MMKKAAIYARKSTEDDRCEDNKSVTRQVERARACCEARGWTVADEHVFVDDGISGAEFKNRPGLLRMLNRLSEFDVIVMSEQSRLGREQSQTSGVLADIYDSGVRVFLYLTREELRFELAVDKFMVNAVSFAAELEREKASQRVRDALERKALKGCNTGGRVYGWSNVWVMEDGRRVIAPPGAKRSEAVARTEYEVDERQAEAVRAIYRMRADGHGVRKIAKTLNGDPLYAALSKACFGGECPPSPRGGPCAWAPTSVYEILRNERYTGVIPWGEYRNGYRKGAKVRIRQDKYERVPAPHLRIVPDELWRAVRERDADSRRTYLTHTNGARFGRAGPGRESKYLLTALARCGCCKANIVAEPYSSGPPGARKRFMYYGCSGHKNRGVTFCPNNHRVPMEKVEEAVLEAIERQVLKPEYLAYAVDRALRLDQERRHVNPDRPREIEAEIKKLKRELERFVALIAEGEAPRTILDEIRQREARIEALERELSTLRAPEPDELHAARLKRALCERAARFKDTLRADVPRARQALRQLLVEPLLTFNPVMVDGKKAFAFEGRTQVGALLDPLCMEVALPRGLEPLFSP